MNDATPPTIRTLPAPRGTIRLAVTDKGSGVDPTSLSPKVDGARHPFTLARGVLTIRNVRAGRHLVTLTASDYQEAKNMENVGPILPNTRRFSSSVLVD